MKITVFDRTKYIESLSRLKKRNAPNYILEAYKDGYISAVNEYYRVKLSRRKDKSKIEENIENLDIYAEAVKIVELDYLNEALSKKDLDFLKAFFKMTNMDIFTGSRLPPNASSLIKQGAVKDLGLKDLFKKLK